MERWELLHLKRRNIPLSVVMWSSLRSSRVYETLCALCNMMSLTTVVIRHTVRSMIRGVAHDPKLPRIVRVLAIDERRGIFEYMKWDPEVMIGRGWEHVSGIGEDGRVEIRLVHMYSKRRVVLYPGDELDVTFPKPPRGVFVQGTLIPRRVPLSRDEPGSPVDEPGSPVDILSRVQKYHGNELRCASHMFPFDDPDALRDRFEHVYTMDVMFKRRYLRFADTSSSHMTDTKKGSERSECEAD